MKLKKRREAVIMMAKNNTKKIKLRHKVNKYLATVMSLLIISALPVQPVKAQDEEGLTEIHISTVEDLKELAVKCRLDSWSTDKKVILDKSLELNGEEFTAIPTFGGIFEGKGNTINGLSITKDGSYQGLFRYVQSGAVIQNLTVKGNVSPKGTSAYAGGIAGSNRGMIVNCKFTGVCNGKNNVGGICGVNEEAGVIRGCIAEGMVYAEHYAAGIAGMNLGLIEDCSNSSSVNTRIEQMDIKLEDISVDTLKTTEDAADITDIGGIAGYSSGTLKDNKNYGDVGYQHKGYNIGGIAGRQSGYVTGCNNYGQIYGRKEVGGIVGQMEPYKNLTFSETTLSKLRSECDALESGIDRTISDARGYSDEVSGKLTQISAEAGKAGDSLDILMDKTEKMINTDVNQVNELSSAISKAVDMLVPVCDYMESAADSMETASGKMKDAVSKMNSSSGDVEKVVEITGEALECISVNQEYIDAATEAVNNAIDALRDGRTDDAADYLKDAVNAVNDSVSGLSDAADKISEAKPYMNNINDTMTGALKILEEGMNSMSGAGSSLSDSAEGMGNVIVYLSKNVDFKLVSIDSTQIKAREDFMSSIDTISDLLQELNLTVNSNNNLLADDLQQIADTMSDITDIIIDARENAQESIDDAGEGVDVSNEDEQGEACGKVDLCVNYGHIQGDVNVGGIAGAMSVEHDFDPEDDIEIEGEASVKFDYSTKAVIRDSENRGKITAKKDCAGGIAGNVELGCIISCNGYGSVESTGGNYIGGIAGNCKTIIRDSNAKCLLSGNNYVGGIAGCAGDISNCRSLVKVTKSNEKTGTIAGEATGDVSDNYFVSDSLAGIDGVSYAKKAEPVSWEEFKNTEGIPEEFLDFKLTFIANGTEVYVYDFEYGASFDTASVPKIPEREGFQAKWEDYDYSYLTFDDTIEAVYTQYVTAIESEQMRSQDRAMLLVEGEFTSEDTINVTALENAPEINGKLPDECWCVTIPDDKKETHKIHYLLPDNIKKAKVAVLSDGQWKEAECDTDGKYIVFEAEGNNVTFCIIRKSGLIVYFTAAAVIVSLCAVILVKRRNLKKKTN